MTNSVKAAAVNEMKSERDRGSLLLERADGAAMPSLEPLTYFHS